MSGSPNIASLDAGCIKLASNENRATRDVWNSYIRRHDHDE